MASFLGDMFHVAWHTLVVFLFLVVTFRFVARRILGQLTVIELVVILLMGSAVETAMVAGNVSLPAGIVCAGLLMVLTWGMAKLVEKSKKAQVLFGGSAVVLVQNGKPNHEIMKRYGLNLDQVMEGIRERGTGDIADVKYAVLEIDGEITVVTKNHRSYRTDKSKILPNPPSL